MSPFSGLASIPSKLFMSGKSPLLEEASYNEPFSKLGGLADSGKPPSLCKFAELSGYYERRAHL